ncbi:MAG TPA: ATP-binding cassette domain-containing protein, partial [Gemmatimonadaceae bacterium]|nr:ATP-binding cassette domain-containing protein [Gemmatimonadaceae bacterium]
LYGVDDPGAKTERALASMQILDRADTPVRALSRGMKQRVSIARATVHEPDLVLADEPFTGLDVVGSKALTSLLMSLKDRGAALVIVTHNLEEGLSLSSYAAIMNSGKLVRSEARSAIDPESFTREYQELVELNA